MYVCICWYDVYICAYICVCLRTCLICIYVCTYVYPSMYVCTCVFMYLDMYVNVLCMHARIFMYICMYACTYVCAYMYVCNTSIAKGVQVCIDKVCFWTVKEFMEYLNTHMLRTTWTCRNESQMDIET